MPERITDLNALDSAAFTAALEPTFEGPPWIQEQTWHRRPFGSRAELHAALVATMMASPMEQQVALINAHPDLVGRAALAGTLTASSQSEQTVAGLNTLTPDEIALFTSQNAAYRARFGFTFVICARQNKKESILAGFSARLDNDRALEIQTALSEIAKIADLRLRDQFPEP